MSSLLELNVLLVLSVVLLCHNTSGADPGFFKGEGLGGNGYTIYKNYTL